MCVAEACICAGGVWQGGMHGGWGHGRSGGMNAWQGVCMCVAGGMHDEGVKGEPCVHGGRM